MLTLFSWGYWGWGRATQELIRTVDTTERQRGFRPPVFIDIRLKRNCRAPGFRGDEFEKLLPQGPLPLVQAPGEFSHRDSRGRHED